MNTRVTKIFHSCVKIYIRGHHYHLKSIEVSIMKTPWLYLKKIPSLYPSPTLGDEYFGSNKIF